MQHSKYSSFSLTSRTTLRAVSLLMAASTATGCVAAKHYEEARSVAEAEAQAHARTQKRLAAALERIQKLEGDLADKEQSLADNERRIADKSSAVEESKLASTVATKEKEAAVQLIEELRSELARTGDNLTLYAREKQNLTETLLLAERRMNELEASSKALAELVGLTRDLSLALDVQLEQGKVRLSARDGQVVLAVPPETLFASGRDTLAADAVPLVAAVGKASKAHPSLRIVLSEPSGGEPSPRLERLGAALRERGVNDARLVLPVAKPAETGGDGAAEAARDAPGTATAAVPAPSAPDAPPTDYEIAFLP